MKIVRNRISKLVELLFTDDIPVSINMDGVHIDSKPIFKEFTEKDSELVENVPEPIEFCNGLSKFDGEWSITDKVKFDEITASANAAFAKIIRQQRDNLLKESDWTQGRDIPEVISKPWAEYRQQLRDITKQESFPDSPVWPVAPKR